MKQDLTLRTIEDSLVTAEWDAKEGRRPNLEKVGTYPLLIAIQKLLVPLHEHPHLANTSLTLIVDEGGMHLAVAIALFENPDVPEEVQTPRFNRSQGIHLKELWEAIRGVAGLGEPVLHQVNRGTVAATFAVTDEQLQMGGS